MSLAPITPNSIKKMAGIDERPVFFISLSSSPFSSFSMTVKGELKSSDLDAISIKWGSKMMKNVNSSKVNTQIMTPTEITEFKRAARILLGGVKNQAKLTVLNNDAQIIWIKMPYVKNLSDVEMYKKNVNGDYVGQKDKIKILLTRFTDSKTWRQLGKVIAVDVFIGNGDRFNVAGNFVNQGNVMFQSRVGGLKVIGLDTFDGKNQASNLAHVGDLALLKNILSVIKGGQATTDYATTIISEVEYEIGRAIGKSGIDEFRIKTGPFSSVGIAKDSGDYLTGYIPDLESGINEGVRELKEYLLNKYRQYNAPNSGKALPIGVIARMREMNWI